MRDRRYKNYPLILLMMSIIPLSGLTWHVRLDGSGDFTAIQAGIDAASHGDTVLVYPGTYYENLDTNGKNITLCSLELTTGDNQYIYTTIIDGQRLESCIRIHNGETNLLIRGFTIQNGFGTDFWAHDGGGVLIHDYSTATLVNCLFQYNLAAEGGAILARRGYLNVSGLLIRENIACYGGAIFLDYDSTINFDPVNRCNIYNNHAGKGADLFSIRTGQIDVIVDTFSVFEPSRYFAEHDDGPPYTFDIQHNWMELVPHDLYVAPDGDDANSGLSPGEPLRNISWAVRRIQADAENPRTVHVAAGTYSWELNQQIYPIGCKEFVSIVGEDMESTILINDFMERAIIGYFLVNRFEISNFTIINGFEEGADRLINIQRADSVHINNLIFTNSLHMKSIFDVYKVGIDFKNIVITNCQSPFTPGFSLAQAHGKLTNCRAINNSSTQTSYHDVESALYLFAVGDILFENCEFSNNISYGSTANTIRTASDYNADPNIRMVNCLITGNVSNSDRNMYIMGKGNNEFINCTIADNSSTNYTIRACGDITLTNSIVYNNNSYEILMEDESPWGFTYELNVNYSSFRNGQYSIYNQNNANIVNWGTGNLALDPEFEMAGDNPYALSAYSPCIDTGMPDTTGLYLPPWDLLHNERVWDGDGDSFPIIDMGCYEYGAPYYVDTDETVIEIPEVSLFNYPNPFNPSTRIRFGLSKESAIDLRIYNNRGQLVRVLISGRYPAGQSEATWDGKDQQGRPAGSGIYLISLQTGEGQNITRKCVLIK